MDTRDDLIAREPFEPVPRAALLASAPLARGRFRLRRRLRHLLSRLSARRARLDLISSLQEVASAVSSTLSVYEVLDSVVTHAKRVTNTDKAIVCLFHEDDERLDAEHLVVRGARSKHPESWWSEQLEGIAEQVYRTGRTYLHLDGPNDAWLLCVPVKVQEHPIGLLCAINSRKRRFEEEQVAFLVVLASFAASALENARLAEQARYSLLASERDRIAREMHDGLSQSLFSVSLGLEVCRKQVVRDPAGTRRRLAEVSELLASSLADLRRYIYDLRPMKLRELGLAGAIEFWVQEMTCDRPLAGRVVVEGEQQRLALGAEVSLYRIAREAIGNAIKHAGASDLEVLLRFESGSVTLSVSDDGEGFDVDSAFTDSDAGNTIGLRSMRQRIEQEGGTLEVFSDSGEGTRLVATMPIEGEGEERWAISVS
ncbi:MAG: GAF domain-containing sensor histidine kinase [Coriobacteriia bacterium]|nr:GAF domain-containing sensor histidine kinase [Coriobacteriia bacterium]